MSRRRGTQHLRQRKSLQDLLDGMEMRRLRVGEEPGVGQVIYSDGMNSFVLSNHSDNEALRELMRSHCPECAASVDDVAT